MMVSKWIDMIDNANWAKKTFGHAKLGDPRRTERLVKLAETIANDPGKPLVNITQSPADMEGAYRFIRNEHVKADSIANAGYQVTAEQAQHYPLLLALEDTTTITYQHHSIKKNWDMLITQIIVEAYWPIVSYFLPPNKMKWWG